MAYGAILGQTPKIPELYSIGDIKTTVRTDLGENWLLCNGDEIDPNVYSQLSELLSRTANNTKETVVPITYVGDWPSPTTGATSFMINAEFVKNDKLYITLSWYKYSGGDRYVPALVEYNISTGEARCGPLINNGFTSAERFDGTFREIDGSIYAVLGSAYNTKFGKLNLDTLSFEYLDFFMTNPDSGSKYNFGDIVKVAGKFIGVGWMYNNYRIGIAVSDTVAGLKNPDQFVRSDSFGYVVKACGIAAVGNTVYIIVGTAGNYYLYTSFDFSSGVLPENFSWNSVSNVNGVSNRRRIVFQRGDSVYAIPSSNQSALFVFNESGQTTINAVSDNSSSKDIVELENQSKDVIYIQSGETMSRLEFVNGEYKTTNTWNIGGNDRKALDADSDAIYACNMVDVGSMDSKNIKLMRYSFYAYFVPTISLDDAYAYIKAKE